jgi:hypothetical protein
VTGNGTHHIPLRRCVGCGGRHPKPDLVRLVADPVRGVDVDSTRTRGGRGAYLCRDEKCMKRALARGSLPRALRAPQGASTAELAGRFLEAVS